MALGDVLLERGERLAAGGDGGGAAAALQRALAEGYQAAQRLSAGSPEAAVGVGDVHVQVGAGGLGGLWGYAACKGAAINVCGPAGRRSGPLPSLSQLARLAAAAQDAAAAAGHWAAAEAAYRAALQRPTAFDFRERCDLRYNHACALNRCGRGGEAAGLLRALLALGATSAQDVAADADLAGVPL